MKQNYATSFRLQAHEVGPLGRWAVGPLMVCAFYGVSSVAQAQSPTPTPTSTLIPGQWNKHFKIESGKGVGHSDFDGSNYVFNFASSTYGDFEVGDYSSSGGAAYVQSGGQGGAASGFGNGSSAKVENAVAKVTYKWGRQGGGPLTQGEELAPPDGKLSFFLYGGAGAFAYGGQQDVSVSVDGNDSPENSKFFVALGSKRLFSFETEGGTEFSGTIPIKGSASGDVTSSVTFNFDSQIDYRSLSISSPTLEPSYHKGQLPAYPVLHIPQANGDKKADSVVHLSDGQWQTPATHFNANLGGVWNSPTFDWSSTGDNGPAIGFNLSALYQEHSPTAYTAFDLGSDASGFPKTSNIKVKVTDGQDGTVGENSFDINWHLQYEKDRNLPDGPKHKEISWVGQTHIPVENGVGVATVPARTLDSQAAINGILQLAELGGVPGASEIGKIFELVTGLSEWQTTEPSYSISTDDLKNDPAMFKQVLSANPDNIQGLTLEMRNALLQKTPDELRLLMNNYTCHVARIRFHKQKRYLADKYDLHGYAGWDNLFTYDETYPNGGEFQLLYSSGNQSPPPSEGDSEIPPSFNVS